MRQIIRPHVNEIITACILILLLGAFVGPVGLLMPMTTSTLYVLLFVVSFFVYLGVIWKEYARDEREHAHQLNAGRTSFLVGTSVITLGIVMQALRHNIDPWLVYSLGLMLLTKIIVRIYSNIRQ